MAGWLPDEPKQMANTEFPRGKWPSAPPDHPSLGDVKTVKVHHLVPRRQKVLDKLRLRVRAPVDLGQGPELGVGAEDEIDTRAGPLQFARLAIAPFEHVLGVRYCLPPLVHAEHFPEQPLLH